MKTLILISKTPIVLQIFDLVCKKLSISLIAKDNNDIKEEADIIVIDDDFIDDRFNIIKQYSKRLGAITKEELPFEKAKDFVIPRPFLPSKLQEVLQDEIKIIEEKAASGLKENSTVKPVIDYIESLAQDVAEDIADEVELQGDDSIVFPHTLNDGGVLDSTELYKIKDILNDNSLNNNFSLKKSFEQNEDYDEMSEEDWLDLSQIIDNAIDEVKEYEFSQDTPIKLILNNYNMKELRPLFEKLDQEIVDTLARGEEISLQLKLKDSNNE